MKKLIFTLTLMGLFFVGLNAQTPEHHWGIGLSINPKEYYGQLGSNVFKFKEMNLSPGIQITRYLDNIFDLGLHANFGRLLFNSKDPVPWSGFDAKFTDIGLDLNVKLNNGGYIKEDALIQPYGIFGLGVVMYNNPDSSIAKGNSLNLFTGAGLRIRLTDRLHLGYSMTFNANLNENYDHPTSLKSDAGFLKHSLSITYSFGKGNVIVDKTKDSDGDGVPDYLDKCPTTYPGLRVDKNGCVRELTAEERELKLISDKVFFDFDSTILKEESKIELDKLVKYLNDKKWLQLYIEGHTDNVGDALYNHNLSHKRADAVKEYLIYKGIDASKISTFGHGPDKPIVSNDSDMGRALNRRVEFRIMR